MMLILLIQQTSTNIINAASQGCTSANVSSVTTGGPTCGATSFSCEPGPCNISVIQTGKATCNLNSNNLNSVSGTYTTQLSTNLQNYVTQQSTSKQKTFLTTAVSLGFNYTQFNEKLGENIKDTLTTNITQTCSAQSNAMNQSILLLCGFYSDLNLLSNQNASVVAMTSCINNNIIKFVTSDTNQYNILVKANQQLLNEQTSGTSFLFSIGIAIAILIVVVAIIWLIEAFRQPKKQYVAIDKNGNAVVVDDPSMIPLTGMSSTSNVPTTTSSMSPGAIVMSDGTVLMTTGPPQCHPEPI